jgi:hypothetical protein
LVARFVWDEDVAGSNPVSPTLLVRRTSQFGHPPRSP